MRHDQEVASVVVLRDLIEGVARRLSPLGGLVFAPVAPLLDAWEQDLAGPWESFIEGDDMVGTP